jgi:hypothetical protein
MHHSPDKPRVLATSEASLRHHVGMSVAFTVQADSEAEAHAALRRLCEALGLVPTLPPRLLDGRRWMARAAQPVEADQP